MKRTLILAVGCGLFASVAFAQTPPAGAPPAQDFVNKVAVSDMFEIQSSQIALAKQADADTYVRQTERSRSCGLRHL